MATYYHANGGGNGGGNDWGSWIPIIVLFCIPTPVTWIIALIWLASKLRGGGKRGKNWQGGVSAILMTSSGSGRLATPMTARNGSR